VPGGNYKEHRKTLTNLNNKHTIDFKLFVQQKHAPFYENTCSLAELDEKPNQKKIQNLEILQERVAKQRTHFLNHLIKKYYVQWVQNV